VHEAAADLTPLVDVSRTNDNNVGGDAQAAQGPAQAHRLLAWMFDAGLYDEEIEIASAVSIAAGVRPKEDDACAVSSCAREPTTGLLD
jgi:hypothetical protein